MTQHHIDKKRAQASFNKASASYEDAAVFQKHVLGEMFLRLKLLKINPNIILDLGCGPGNAGPDLKAAYKPRDLIYLDFAYDMLKKAEEKNKDYFLKAFTSKTAQQFICADMEAIPLLENSVDMVWSNLSLQWCNDLDQVFTQIAKTLTHNGLFIFSTLGPSTLQELRASLASFSKHSHVNQFIDMHDIGDALIQCGFSDPVLDVDVYTLTYSTFKEIMYDLKHIGARNALQGRARSMTGKGFLYELEKLYEVYRADEKLPATYEVVYGHAWKVNKQLDESSIVKFYPKQ
ncbi:MAG: malonyl-ACP O-methyltransferase BioC [Candidatus Methylopumilus sp.]